MKKILLSMLALVALAGCSKSANTSGVNSDDLVAIQLGAGVASSAKAPIVTGSTVNAGIAGWENTSTETYASTPTWATDITTTAHASTQQTVTWTTSKYYNADNNTKTYMKVWYPKGTLAGTSVTFPNTAGDVDVLLAPAISGSKDDASGKTLAFVHKTTQLKFKVIAGAGLSAGTQIKRITLKNVQLPVGFDLSKDATADDAVSYATAGDLNIANLTQTTIPAIAISVGDAVMFKPWSDNTLTIDVETNETTYTAKTFTTSDFKLSEGSSYEVTLSFGQAGIGLTATIAEWNAATGSGSIE